MLWLFFHVRYLTIVLPVFKKSNSSMTSELFLINGTRFTCFFQSSATSPVMKGLQGNS